jgi:hypothetical protein
MPTEPADRADAPRGTTGQAPAEARRGVSRHDLRMQGAAAEQVRPRPHGAAAKPADFHVSGREVRRLRELEVVRPGRHRVAGLVVVDRHCEWAAKEIDGDVDTGETLDRPAGGRLPIAVGEQSDGPRQRVRVLRELEEKEHVRAVGGDTNLPDHRRIGSPRFENRSDAGPVVVDAVDDDVRRRSHHQTARHEQREPRHPTSSHAVELLSLTDRSLKAGHGKTAEEYGR